MAKVIEIKTEINSGMMVDLQEAPASAAKERPRKLTNPTKKIIFHI